MGESAGVEDAGLRGASARRKQARYLLELYVCGATPRSRAAVRNLRALCEELLRGRYRLEVIDVYARPDIAAAAQVLAIPTLVLRRPGPVRRLVGDMSDRKKVLRGLGLGR